mmetsp:Transcript_39526/g.103688  ORF Transcript_39526/g.103688 Transcript_39526/m.103688 type:complete len:171 (+) Transcript_39526:1-513(+)
MEHFGNMETMPVYYVLFTLSTLVGSNILYKDFEDEDAGSLALFCGGCLFTFGGVKLLTSRPTVAYTVAKQDASPAVSPPEPAEERDYYLVEGARERLLSLPRSTIAAPSRGSGYVQGADLLQPLTLLNTPLGLFSDVIRRTFASSSEQREGVGALAADCGSGRAGSGRSL